MIHNEKIYSNKYDKLKVLSTLPQPMPILVPTQHHPLKMPMKPTHHVLPIPPVHIPNNMTHDSTASNAPHESQSSINTNQQTSNRNCAMSIEMITMSRQTKSDTDDRSKLAEMQIANARRRQRAVLEANAEQQRRADDLNTFNNFVCEANTRRTKSYQQKRKSDQH